MTEQQLTGEKIIKKPGRPATIPDKVQMQVWLSRGQRDAIDRQRGTDSRGVWLRAAIARELAHNSPETTNQ